MGGDEEVCCDVCGVTRRCGLVMPVVARCYSGVTCNTTARHWVVVVVTPGDAATFASTALWGSASPDSPATTARGPSGPRDAPFHVFS